jgi:hypothetical protein
VTSCLCVRYAPSEHLKLWLARATPTLRRQMCHGHYKPQEVARTVRLVLVAELGNPDRPADLHRSHHLLDCPAAPRNRNDCQSLRTPCLSR